MKKVAICLFVIAILLLGIVGCGKQAEVRAEIRVINALDEDVEIESFVVIPKSISEITQGKQVLNDLDLYKMIQSNLVEENNRAGESFRYVLSSETIESGSLATIFISLLHRNIGWRDGHYFKEVPVTDLISITFSKGEEPVAAVLEYKDGTTLVIEGYMYFIS